MAATSQAHHQSVSALPTTQATQEATGSQLPGLGVCGGVVP